MKYDAVKNESLGKLADIGLGYPFRGAITAQPGGSVAVISLKNIEEDASVAWDDLIRTELTGKKKPDFLQVGDVIFSARGTRNVASYLGSVPCQAVCAPQFYLLRVKRDELIPAFLGWYLNSDSAQKYFSQTAEGSVVTSIRRAVLEALPVPVPPLEKQQLIVDLADAVAREKKIMQTLMRNRDDQLRLVTRSLVQ